MKSTNRRENTDIFVQQVQNKYVHTLSHQFILERNNIWKDDSEIKIYKSFCNLIVIADFNAHDCFRISADSNFCLWEFYYISTYILHAVFDS